MKAQLILLAELQALESKIHSIEANRSAIFGGRKGLQAEVDKQRLEHRALTAKLDELEKERRGKDGELQMDRDKLRKWESRLEDIKHGREFAALAREVEGLKRANNDINERLYEILSESEALGTKSEDAQKKLRVAEAALTEETRRAESSLLEHDQAIVEQRALRDRVAAQLPVNLLKRFEQLTAKRAGLAVVPVRESICKGCHMGIPPQIAMRVSRGETLETCASCNRMLYAEELLLNRTNDIA